VAALIENLGQSLLDAGENFSGHYAVTTTGDEELGDRVALHIKERFPKGSKTFVTKHIRDYTCHSGWLSKNFRWYRNRLEFNCAPAMRHPVLPGSHARTSQDQ
jgi:hypothetical protein